MKNNTMISILRTQVVTGVYPGRELLGGRAMKVMGQQSADLVVRRWGCGILVMKR